ncbi:hypothetical protein B4N89_03780 [Embleya scabrispora]|uniref:Uncharacterized protein n=1 Tax=Embleya scabrispora TaxID=159449 RepID=A0A1T3NTS8_9ACTN|nr:hypothetical protein B4N89_03780 [Embleya scabrispora]
MVGGGGAAPPTKTTMPAASSTPITAMPRERALPSERPSRGLLFATFAVSAPVPPVAFVATGPLLVRPSLGIVRSSFERASAESPLTHRALARIAPASPYDP